MSNDTCSDLGGWQLFLGVCLTSLGVLLLEISLTRIFSFTIWYHFAYVTISVALLGFGAAGSVLAAAPQITGTDPFRFLSLSAACAALATIATLTLLALLPLDPLRIMNDPSQLLVLLVYYLAVTVPFFFAGLCVSGAISLASERIGRLYFWDLLGAGTGCALVVPFIWRMGTPGAALTASTCLAIAALTFSLKWQSGRWKAFAALAVASALVSAWLAPRLHFAPNSGKYLAKFMALPGATHVFSRWTPINRVDFVSLATGEGSYATEGISPTYRGPKPHYGMVSHDGEGCAVMYEFTGKLSDMELFRYHLLRTPYQFLSNPQVLVIGLGGGADLLNGLVNGAGSIVGVEINPVTVEIGKNLLAGYNGGIFNHPDVRVVAAEGRNYLRSRDDKYDLIEINSVDTFAALSTGAYVLSESYLYTVDAMVEYLDHLKPGGIFAMATWDSSGVTEVPRHNTRIVSALREALTSRGLSHPERHVVVVASVARHTFAHALAKNEPFTVDEIDALERFTRDLDFEIWQRPDRPVDNSPASLIMWGSKAARDDFYASSTFRLRATSDESPFFFNFAKWRGLLGRLASGASETVETGQKVLLLMFLQAVVLSTLLILGPLGRLRSGLGNARMLLSYLGYFVAVGLGFILIEISFIQRFTLFLGYPTYALTVVLLSLLLFTGAGSYMTEKVTDRLRAVKLLLAGLAFVALAYLVALPVIFERFLGTPLPVRIGLAILLLCPLGLLMGGFFPHGIRIVGKVHPALVPWGWAANGCATVIGTVTAVIIAITWSFQVVTAAAVAVYAIGVAALLRASKPEPQ